MYIINRFRLSFFVVFFLLVSSVFVYASQIDDMYKDLTLLDRTAQIGRKSYTTMGDKFYKIYADNPSGKYADDALLGAARAYRRSFERFNMQIDLDKSLNYYRMVQGAFSSAAARRAYIESADIFLARRDSTSAKFTLNKNDKVELERINYSTEDYGYRFNDEVLIKTCLTEEQLESYLLSKDGIGYAWYIDNLQILDEPISLSENVFGNPKTNIAITKAPQSWCYCIYNKSGFMSF